MQFLTDFADQAVVLPLLAAVALALWLAGWRRGAAAWCVAVPATLAVVGVAKLVVFMFGPFAVLPLLRSPSGHTASAALAYGGLAAMLVARRGWAWALLASGFAAVAGFTRLELHVHSRIDVAVGAAIGIAGALLLARLAGDRPGKTRAALPVVAVALVALLFHGEHLPVEVWLHQAANALLAFGQR